MQVWGGFFPGQLTAEPVSPAPLAGTTVPVGGSAATVIPVGGSAATVIPVGTTDAGHSSVVHVPGLSLVVSGDAVYNQTHMWLSGSTPDSRASWARALDTVAALEAGIPSPTSETRWYRRRSLPPDRRTPCNTSPSSRQRWNAAPPRPSSSTG